ncbi:hypothetical protein G6R29_04480 [Fructobacillus sp. M2-14]|uniref:Integral membrane protein n=1 Tax=Fructobacillus broussonetiae TaxID=2713173 RepID=A0ABS5R0D2_9LACO|nr:hypothetical protein [Fructobacillus broussonetiae]MBS9338880.1 hypothetical protein [Fructobacillus broussonetiae]
MRQILTKKIKELFPFIILLFTSLLILNGLLFTPIRLDWDSYYHLSRVHNLSQGFFSFLYPQNFNSLGKVGLATNVFYPSLTVQFIVSIIPTSLSALAAYKLFVFIELYLISLVLYLLLRFKMKNSTMSSLFFAVFWGAIVICFDVEATGGEALCSYADKMDRFYASSTV